RFFRGDSALPSRRRVPRDDPSSQIQTYANLHESPPLSFVAASSFDQYKEEQILAFPVAVVCGRSGRYTVAGGKPSLLQCHGGGAVGLQLYRKHFHCERLGTCRSCRLLSSGCSG